MPKVSPDGINRSEKIRDYFSENPHAKIKDCIDSLHSLGIDVSYGLVASVRSRSTKEQEVGVEDKEKLMKFAERSNLDPDVALRILSDFHDLALLLGGLERFKKVLESCKVPVESSYYDPNEDE